MFPSKRVQSLVGRRVHVEMKGEKSVLEGVLTSADEYLNLHLSKVNELEDGERKRQLGSVVVRGNNVVLLTPLEERTQE
ncbi:MAG: LSM domain-containing protein [Candidatus Methanospirareceae archaeon]|nr:MAG: LSM domain-containing protein [Methanophagales archaeon]HDN68288.1 LSM domain-containing protein [Methanomicrobia archaeon]